MAKELSPLVTELLSNEVQNNDALRLAVMELGGQAIKEVQRLLKYGTPDVKISLSRALLPIMVRGATEVDDSVSPAEKIHERTRQMFREMTGWEQDEVGDEDVWGEGEEALSLSPFELEEE